VKPLPLSDFPRPHVAVDVALLTVRPTSDRPELVTLVQDRTEELGGHSSPGRFIRERHTVAQTVDELLHLEVGISLGRRRPHPFLVLDDPDRDTRAWGLSIGTWLAIPWGEASRAHGTWRPISSTGSVRGTRLLFDHDRLLKAAVAELRDRHETEPDPERLLSGAFTLLDLRRLHEAVLGTRLRKDTFNRRMRERLVRTGDETTRLSLPRLAEPGASGASRRGRPAELYRHPRRMARQESDHWRLPREQ
jgi:8-oxo-dGTP diphosphatase